MGSHVTPSEHRPEGWNETKLLGAQRGRADEGPTLTSQAIRAAHNGHALRGRPLNQNSRKRFLR